MTRLYIVDQSGLEVGGHYYSYTGCVADGARKRGLDVVVLANKKFRVEQNPADYPILPCFTYTWAEAELQAPLEWRAGNIAYEIARALRRHPAGPEDHVFLHTIGYRELLCLLEWFVTGFLPGDPLPYFHLLLRRDPDILIENYKDYARYFRFIAASPYLRGKLHFHADTELLTAAFTELTGLPFATAPIPFPQEHLIDALAARPPRRPGDPLTAIYLGDARLEKGYQHLPAALAHLWPNYVSKGKIRFVLQSNFNTPGGESGILTAAQNLAGHPNTVLLNEPLQPAEYYQALADADLVLIPYSAQSYRYRSSGVLIEAMAAGKPVVTTTGSWMAAQVESQGVVMFDTSPELGPAIAVAVDRYDQLSREAQSRAGAVLETATGDNLVRHLLSACPGLHRSDVITRRRILLVMNGDGMVLQNGSARIAQAQLRYLADAGYSVVGLFLTSRMEQTAAELAAWRAALGDAIKPFTFERVFIAGPGERSLSSHELGAICDDRRPPDWPLQAEFDFVATFEFGAPLLRYLQQQRVDAVVLNYITNFPVLDALGIGDVPVICELHDLQSLQRAIYSGRQPDPEDFDIEFRWLARCAGLISLTPRESAIIRERLPHIPIETTGVVLPDPPPPLQLLAGVTDLTELVEMAGYTEKEQRQDILARLGETGFIDLLFVSSNHLANVSGLRWFLDEVYEPHLAAHQVSLVIAGTICDIADWPDLPRVFFIGPVNDLAPLYAATRVVVLPILEGAGSPVKSFEALAYGRPVVATPHAFRGVEADVAGTTLTDDPSAFSEAVLALINSEPARKHAALQSRQLAGQHNDSARYYRSMDRVFEHLWGGPKQTAAPAVVADEWVPIEWSMRLQALNRLVRSFIEGSPLDGWAISLLLRDPGTDLDWLIDNVSRLLLQPRIAPVQIQGSRFDRPTADDLTFAIRLALGRSPAAEPSRIIVSAELLLDVATVTPRALAIDGRPLKFRQVAGLDGAAGAVLFHGQTTAPQGGRTGLRVIELTAGACDNSRNVMVLRHSVPIDPNRRLFGKSCFGGGFALHGDGTAELRPGATGLLRLPRVADGRGASFVGLMLVNPSAGPARPFALTLNGMSNEPQVFQIGSLALLRLLIDSNTPSGDFGELLVELSNRHPQSALRLVGVYSGLMIGAPAEAAHIATLLATSEQRPVAIRSPRVSEMAQNAVLPILRGEPLSPAALSLLAGVATGDAGMLAPLVQQVLRRQGQTNGQAAAASDAKTVVDDINAIVGAYYGTGPDDAAVISPALTVTITDRNGRERLSAGPRSWKLPIPPTVRSLQIRLDAALDVPGHPGIIRNSGFHPAENEAAPFRWTGPATSSKILIPIALTMLVRLDLRFGRIGQNTETDHFVLFCNGDTVPHDLAVADNGALLSAMLPAAGSAAPWTEIVFTIAHQFTPPLPDLRVLGVVFRSLTLTLTPRSAATPREIPTELAADG